MKSRTEPFRVICKLLDGRVNSADGFFFLDSILYHAWFLKYAPKVIQGTVKQENPKHFGLPLRQLDNNRYAASMGFYPKNAVAIEYWNKRPAWDRRNGYLDAKGKMDTASGVTRAYRTPNVIRHIPEIEFYGYGTIDKVKELLEYIPSIGKKSSMGWGAVKEWIVEPFTEDWSTWSEKYGLMRPIPTSEKTGYKLGEYSVMNIAIRPPAWKYCNHEVCFIPRFEYEL